MVAGLAVAVAGLAAGESVMSSDPRLVLITPTWRGDLEHFRAMRCSLEHSGLAELDHYVIVQNEDLSLFEEFRGRAGLILLSTKDVLPESVERRRMRARMLSEHLGRNFTRICGSLRRVVGWPLWPSYTGWHTQQICKLKLASELGCDKAVILDSDVVVTPSATVQDFLASSRIVCFTEWRKRSDLSGKVRNWVLESERLVDADHEVDPVNTYFDTPFVFDRRVLSAALAYLESKNGTAWWSALFERPPRRWSEFGFYKAYLTYKVPRESIDWLAPSFSRYIYDTSDPERVIDTVRKMIVDPDIHYVTIHSQASGRESWDPKAYLAPLLSLLMEGH